MMHGSHGKGGAPGSAYFYLYSATALVAAFAEAFFWSTRGALAVVTACRGQGFWPHEPLPPMPGTGDSIWRSWPASILVGLGSGAFWPLWVVAALAILLRRCQRRRRGRQPESLLDNIPKMAYLKTCGLSLFDFSFL
jgi:hypothetical protein